MHQDEEQEVEEGTSDGFDLEIRLFQSVLLSELSKLLLVHLSLLVLGIYGLVCGFLCFALARLLLLSLDLASLVFRLPDSSLACGLVVPSVCSALILADIVEAGVISTISSGMSSPYSSRSAAICS